MGDDPRFEPEMYSECTNIAKMVFEARQKLIWQYFFVMSGLVVGWFNFGQQPMMWLVAAFATLIFLLLDYVNAKALSECWQCGSEQEKLKPGKPDGIYTRLNGYYWRSLTHSKINFVLFCVMIVAFVSLFFFDLNYNLLP